MTAAGRASPPGASGLFMRTQGVTRFGMPALGPGFAGVPRAPGLTLPPAGGLPSDWRLPSLRRLAAEARFRFPGLLRPGRVASLLDGNKATLPLGDMEIASPFGSSLRRPARRSEMGRWLGGHRLAGGGSLGVALPRRWGRAPAADSAAPPAGPCVSPLPPAADPTVAGKIKKIPKILGAPKPKPAGPSTVTHRTTFLLKPKKSNNN